MPYFPTPDPPWIIQIFAGQEKVRIKNHYAFLVPERHHPSLLTIFFPFTQIRIRKEHTEGDQAAGFPELIQFGYPSSME